MSNRRALQSTNNIEHRLCAAIRKQRFAKHGAVQAVWTVLCRFCHKTGAEHAHGKCLFGATSFQSMSMTDYQDYFYPMKYLKYTMTGRVSCK